MEKLLPQNYAIYDTVYGSETPTEQYYTIKFDKIPSKFLDGGTFYDPMIVDEIKKLGFVEEARCNIKNKRHDSSSQSIYVDDSKGIIIRVYSSNNNNTNKKTKDDLLLLDFSYDIKRGELKEQLDLESIKIHQRPKKKANIQLVKSDMGHLDTEDYDLFVPPTDLELNYGSEFLKIHDVIVDRLNSEYDKGIILLHGDPGTGKTSYIKHLTSLIKDKDILFIPPSMAEMLSEPTIIPFLMDHKNSILIIEDAERVISDREGNGSPAGVSNILNLTDGILGDCLNIQVIATFNMKREKIDQALLRKGRLIAEHKFEKLSIDDTNKLLKHLEKNQEVGEGMVLADIYNIDTEVYKTSTKGNKIGF
jgi:energy-coupling factor transporter ATP-binding protein EcfA2